MCIEHISSSVSMTCSLQWFVYFLRILTDPGKANEVQILLSSTNLNAADENGNSALMVAAERGDQSINCRIV